MVQPSSPGRVAVNLQDAIEELLKLTLQAHIHGKLEFDLGLLTDFCSALLDHDGTFPVLSATATGSATKPLYKLLASALYPACEFSGTSSEEDDLKQNGGRPAQAASVELGKILKSIEFDLHVQEPFFTQMQDGLKTVEGRCARGFYNQIQPGALIMFNKSLVVKVQGVHRYTSFFQMLEAEGLDKVLPGVETIDADAYNTTPTSIVQSGVQVYRRFYTEDEERSNGVISIHVSRTAIQPYIYLAKIISELHSSGKLYSLVGGLKALEPRENR
ncbi:hypothetical protein LINPERHAP2_LOCUS27332 [Linum perenne]